MRFRRPMARMQCSGTIVVGVDGSENAQRALTWALDEARRRSVPCLLVHAVDYALLSVAPYWAGAFEEMRHIAQDLLDTDVAFARERQPSVEVRGVLETGSAAHALVDASADAELLVVGSRGRGGLTGALLGSVSSACVHHAHCPVVVIPPVDRLRHHALDAAAAADHAA
jgi:nucleotide-binding universal stress UspA family protein